MIHIWAFLLLLNPMFCVIYDKVKIPSTWNKICKQCTVFEIELTLTSKKLISGINRFIISCHVIYFQSLTISLMHILSSHYLITIILYDQK